ncbi:MAG: hypothetical protein DRQ10_02100 [Candidatus Hydrothermota bacterium]|nr:MAG: hypothetical protein DRQ10_02100 [Candidatus Hydrothermae bacterium]
MNGELFKQYQILIGLIQRLSERRQHTTQIYLAVNAALLTLSSFIVSKIGFETTMRTILVVAIFAVGIVICEIWHRMLKQYNVLARWRYDFLIKLESEIEGIEKFYGEERKQLESLRYKSFSELEMWLPILFKILYLLVIVFMLIRMV